MVTGNVPLTNCCLMNQVSRSSSQRLSVLIFSKIKQHEELKSISYQSILEIIPIGGKKTKQNKTEITISNQKNISAAASHPHPTHPTLGHT